MGAILPQSRVDAFRRYLEPGSGASETEVALARRLLDAHDLAVASSTAPPTTIYFCGVWPSRREERGHYSFLPDGSRASWRNGHEHSPWGSPNYDVMLDGVVMDAMAHPHERGSYVRRQEPEGLRYHVQKDGWTLVSWWDRSGDPRGGSCAGFAMKGLYTADEAETYAREMFPAVFERVDLYLGRTTEATVLRDRVIRALAEAPQSTWEEIARLLRVEVL